MDAHHQQADLALGPRTVHTTGDSCLQMEGSSNGEQTECSWLQRSIKNKENSLCLSGPGDVYLIVRKKNQNQSTDPVAQNKCQMKFFPLQYQNQ